MLQDCDFTTTKMCNSRLIGCRVVNSINGCKGRIVLYWTGPRMVSLVALLAFSCWCHYWAAAASAVTCEAVGPLANASCRRVASNCSPDGRPADEVGSLCIESDACASPGGMIGDGAAVEITDGLYSIRGLQNFSSNGSVGYCPSPPSYIRGGCVAESKIIATFHVKNLNISYVPINTTLYKATVTWTYFENSTHRDSHGVEAYRLLVTGPGIADPGYCVCINSSLHLTEYDLTLEYDTSIAATTTPHLLSMYTFPYSHTATYVSDSSPESTHSSRAPSNCADSKAGFLYNSTMCSLPRYGKPRNVSIEPDGAHTTRISWDKPCYQTSEACDTLTIDNTFQSDTDPDTYYLTTTTDGIKSHFVVYNATQVILNTSDIGEFKLYAHIPCSGPCDDELFGNGCSEPATTTGEEADNDTCCASPTASPTPGVKPTDKEQPTDSQPDVSRLIYYIPAGAVAAIALLIIVVVLAVVWVKGKRLPQKFPLIDDSPLSTPPTPPPPTPPLPPTPCPVLVVFSPRTPELETGTIRQCLVTDLGRYGVDSSTLGMGQLRQSETDWITEQHKRVSAVFCVCNQQFLDDWNETSANLRHNHNPPIVHTLKLLFHGDLPRRSEGTEKYAVVLMRPEDNQYIPSLLKHRPIYMYEDVESLARFAHNVAKCEV